jgi:hypothetical protein
MFTTTVVPEVAVVLDVAYAKNAGPSSITFAVLAGIVTVVVPATAEAAIVVEPLVEPASVNVPAEVPTTPSVGVAVIDGTPVELVLRTPPFAVASHVGLVPEPAPTSS